MTSRIRRKILAGGLLALAGGLPFSRAFGAASRKFTGLPSVPANDVRTMVWLGQHYLKLHPEEDSAKRIAHALFGDNVVVIDGWVLTRTEARVFALSVKESAS
jgi:hypothetical protein